MEGSVYKFERDMLRGESIHVNKKEDRKWFKKHWHNYYEIIYFKNCLGYCILNGERFDLTDNCLFLLTPKDFHEVVTVENEGAHSYIISFSEQIVDKSLLGLLLSGPFVLNDLPCGMDEQIEKLYGLFAGKSDYRERYLAHLFNCVLIEVLENGKFVDTVPHDINPIVRESIALMLLDSSKGYTLDFFAGKFKITNTYFSYLFRENVGVSFKQYLTALRIECAKRMLEEKDLPIIDVGYECGFNTPSQFIRAFKKLVGMPPSEYRMKNTIKKTS